MNNNKICASTEIAGVVLTNELPTEQLDNFASDPHSVIACYLDLDFANIAIHVVENSAEEIHIALPYYDKIEAIRSEVLADTSMNDVAGGEVITALTFLFGSIGFAFGIGTVSTATATFTTGAVVGGIAITAAVVGSATVGAIGAGAAVGVGVNYANKKKEQGKK